MGILGGDRCASDSGKYVSEAIHCCQEGGGVTYLPTQLSSFGTTSHHGKTNAKRACTSSAAYVVIVGVQHSTLLWVGQFCTILLMSPRSRMYQHGLSSGQSQRFCGWQTMSLT